MEEAINDDNSVVAMSQVCKERIELEWIILSVLCFLVSKYEQLDSILEVFEDRGSSRVWRRSRPFENLSRPFENLSSRVSRLSSGKNKGRFARLTFDTSDFSFLYR